MSRRRSGTSIDLDRVDLTVLVLRARSGDRTAESAFVRRTMRDVWRYCAHVLDVQHADDATQATYLRALRSLDGFRGEAAAKTWLLGVARNVCLDELRSWGRRDRLTAKLRAQLLDLTVELEEYPSDLVAALGRLSTDRREAFVLTQVLGYSYEETATIAGCPIGTIRSRVPRARIELVGQLDDGVGARGVAT